MVMCISAVAEPARGVVDKKGGVKKSARQDNIAITSRTSTVCSRIKRETKRRLSTTVNLECYQRRCRSKLSTIENTKVETPPWAGEVGGHETAIRSQTFFTIGNTKAMGTPHDAVGGAPKGWVTCFSTFYEIDCRPSDQN